MVAIFTYGFEAATENFKNEHVQLHTLSDYGHLIEQAAQTQYIRESQLKTLMEWRTAPDQWQS